MTCIVGLVDSSGVYIGADSLGVAGLSCISRADDKVFHNGPFLIGFTSSFRMGNLLRYKWQPPVQTILQKDDMAFMVVDVIDSIRRCFSLNGFGDKDATHGGTFLIGYRGKLYHIGGDYQVGVSRFNFEAVGCGGDLALGSLFSTDHLAPHPRLTMALKAATAFSAGVSDPFVILKQEIEKQEEVPAPPVKKSAKKASRAKRK